MMVYQPNLNFESVQPHVQVDVLAIAAHPDDVEQTCGGTLLKMAEKGYRTGVLDLTAGDMGTRGDAAQRLEEARQAGSVLKLTWRGNMRLPDARLENTLSARMSLAAHIRRLRPRTVILPYWEGRHPDHYTASRLGYEACYLAGLQKLEETVAPHRPTKIVYAAAYAAIRPSFVVDITPYFERRMEALFSYKSQYVEQAEGRQLFPTTDAIRQTLEAVARTYGNLIGVKYGEGFVMRECLQIDDIVDFPNPSL